MASQSQILQKSTQAKRGAYGIISKLSDAAFKVIARMANKDHGDPENIRGALRATLDKANLKEKSQFESCIQKYIYLEHSLPFNIV